MNRMIVWASGAVLAAGFLSSLVLPVLAGGDLSSIPPDPAMRENEIRGLKTNLTKAIELAQDSLGGGVAESATMTMSGGKASYEVLVYGSGKAVRVQVDGDGKIVQSTEVPRFQMPGEAVSGTPVETSSGLKYYDIKVGDGEQPSPTSRVTVHYTGWFVDGVKFDSSKDRGQPATFGLNQVIKGWTEGVGGMKKGGKRKLIVPYALGYGEGGRQGIPPKAMLIFDVELLEIAK